MGVLMLGVIEWREGYRISGKNHKGKRVRGEENDRDRASQRDEKKRHKGGKMFGSTRAGL